MLFLAPHAAQAQWAAPKAGGQYLLTADELDYDEKNQTATATGHAELSDAQNVLGAQSLFYDQKIDVVEASGGLWLMQPDQSVMFAQKARLSSDFTQGYAEGVGMRMVDNSIFAALQARRLNGRYTFFDKGVFSPCLLCAEDPRKPPLWQVRAARVTHDQEKHDLIYRDAVLEMWGVPTLYTPYLSTPDPTVKRRSGFLSPSFGSNSNIGTFVTIPYYYTFSPDFDVTFRPRFSTVDGFRWGNNLRKRFAHGEIDITDTLVIADRMDDDGSTKKDQIRGDLYGFARFDLGPYYRTGAQFAITTD
ncbi:MAG TPA: putative LPS assembly protein LptD, partial [Alphaproteobacteria bacterium]|nr:putative LPS assembly protein LptD [Alphaproteobacteria bacterium]